MNEIEQSTYLKYMRSSAWANKKSEFRLANKNNRACYVCNRIGTPDRHIHHRSYERFGNEDLNDLVAVHQNCHSYIHNLHRVYPSRSLFYITDLARKRCRANGGVIPNSLKPEIKQKSRKKKKAENREIYKAKARERRKQKQKSETVDKRTPDEIKLDARKRRRQQRLDKMAKDVYTY